MGVYFDLKCSFHRNNASVAASTCCGFRGHMYMYHGNFFEKITQYGEFGCIF